jgi:peptide deformylase
MSDLIRINTEDALKFSTTPIQQVDVFSLVDENDPILRQSVPDYVFTEETQLSTQTLASQLVETCKVKGGYGLAAPQVGISKRVFVMGSGEEYVAFFNPKILNSSKETSLIAEGCLSFPMLAIKIDRPSTVEVEYQDYNGVTRTAIFSGLSAHCFQHELDHLNGVCYTDRAKPLALKMGMKKRNKFNTLVDRYNKANKKLQSTNI